MWRNTKIRRLLTIAAAFAIGSVSCGFGDLLGGDRWIQSLAFSEDGRILVADAEFLLFVWDAETGELRCGVNYSPRYPGFTVGSQVSLDRSGTRVSVNSHTFGAIIIDTETCGGIATLERLPTSPLSPSLSGPPVGMSFSPDGKYVVAANRERPYSDELPLHLYDAVTGERLRSFQTELAKDIMDMDNSAISPDGTRVAGGGGGQTGPDSWGGLVIVWDMESGEQLYRVSEPSPRVEELGFSADGKLLMVRGVTGDARVWDATQGGEPVVLRANCESVEATAFMPDSSSMLVGCESGAVKACDTSSGNCEATALKKVRGLSALAVHPDGNRAAVASSSGKISIFELKSGKRILKLSVPRSAQPIAAPQSSDDPE